MNPQTIVDYAKPIAWRKMTPFVCSGVSTVYAVVRAHQLHRAEASADTLLRFLMHHSDLVMVLCGNTAVWYAVARRQANRMSGQDSGIDPLLVRQLRQVLSALLLGIGLLERRIEQGAYTHLGSLVSRLHAIVRQGSQILERIESA